MKVRGHHGTRLDAKWVNRLHRAMSYHAGPWRPGVVRNVCLTDDPRGIDKQIETVDIGDWWIKYRDYKDGLYNPVGGWWAKVKLFQRDLFGARDDLAIYCDLDTLIVGSLMPFYTPAAGNGLGICADSAENPDVKPGVIRKYNSSVMTWRLGRFGYLYENFSHHTLQTFRSDQDWIAHWNPPAETFAPHLTQRISSCLKDGPDLKTRVVLCIKPKNDEAAKQSEWVRNIWR